jgi:hypothetical protein
MPGACTSASFSTGRQRDVVDVCDRQASAHPRTASSEQLWQRLRRGRPLRGCGERYRRAIDAGLTTTGHANLGRAYARMGRLADAEQEFQLAVDAEVDRRRITTGWDS